jgi:hypothetical protein
MSKIKFLKATAIVTLSLYSLLGCQATKPVRPTSSPTSAAEIEVGMVTGAQQPDVLLEREVYHPGDQINITAVGTSLTDTAWIGIVPSAIPHGNEQTNDDNDLGYVFLKDNERVFLVAPKEPGEYDARLNDADEDGKEIASRSFKVEVDPSPVAEPKLLLDPVSKFAPSSEIDIQFEAPTNFADNAWIGIVPTDTEHGEEEVGDSANMGYEHLNGRSRGTVRLTAPGNAGEFDVRMYDSDDKGKEVGSVSFVVTEE